MRQSRSRCIVGGFEFFQSTMQQRWHRIALHATTRMHCWEHWYASCFLHESRSTFHKSQKEWNGEAHHQCFFAAEDCNHNFNNFKEALLKDLDFQRRISNQGTKTRNCQIHLMWMKDRISPWSANQENSHSLTEECAMNYLRAHFKNQMVNANRN